MGVRRYAPAVLSHVNLLFTLYGGATLATAARLKWDPTTYIALRELFPTEYYAAAAVTAAYGFALLLLPHLGALALHDVTPFRMRSLLLYVYAGVLVLMMVGEVVLAWWTTRQVLAWLGSDAALQMEEAAQLTEHIKPILEYLNKWHPLPERIRAIIQEAEEDLPRNAYVVAATGALLLVLQPLAAVLALCSVTHYKRTGAALSACPEAAPLHPYQRTVLAAAPHETRPLRTKYKDGRIVIL